MIEVEGMFGLWRGLGPTVLRDVPFSGVYWAIYESLKVRNDVTVPTFWFSLFGGATAGSVSDKNSNFSEIKLPFSEISF